MISILLCLCAAQTPALDEEAVALAFSRTLEAVGAVRCGGVAEVREQLVVCGFARADWNSPRPELEFLGIPGTEQYFRREDGGARRVVGQVAWKDRLAPWTWAGPEQAALRLRQISASTAVGTLRLAGLETTGNPRLSERPAVMDVLNSGCSMSYKFTLPISFEGETVDLDFEWDLHSPVSLVNRRLTPEGAGRRLPSIALELEVTDPPMEVDPASLAWDDGSSRELVVHVRSKLGRILRISEVLHPACVALTGITRRESGFALGFRPSPLAGVLHDCCSIRIDAEVQGDPQAFSRFVAVRHVGPMLDEDGRRVIAGVFAPGEHVEVWDRDGCARFHCPDRLPAGRDLLGGSGFRFLCGFDIPNPGGSFNLRSETVGPQGVRLIGMTSEQVLASMEAWSRIGRE